MAAAIVALRIAFRFATIAAFSGIALLAFTSCGPMPTGAAVDHSVEFLIDESAALDVDAVRRDPDLFRKARSSPPTPGFVKGNVWFRLRLEPGDFADVRSASSAPATAGRPNAGPLYFLEIPTLSLREMDIYRDGELVRRTGTQRPFLTRPFPHRHFVLPLQITGDSAIEILFRVSSAGRIEFPLRLWPAGAFYNAILIEYFALGIFLGVVLIMAGYNLILAFVIRESAYFFYVIYSLAIGLFVLQQDGILNHFARATHDETIIVFSVVAIFLSSSGLLFIRSYLELASIAPLPGKLLLAGAVWSILLGVSNLTGIVDVYPIILFNLNFLLVLVLVITGITAGIRAGHPQSKILALAFAVFFLISFSRLLWAFEIVQSSTEWMRHGMKLGIALELMLLSLGLAARYNQVREDLFRTRLGMAEERSRLVGEVHDTIGSRLTAALLHHRAGSSQKVGEILTVALENARDFTAVLKLSNQPDRTLASEIEDFAATYRGIRRLELETLIAPDLPELDLRRRLHVLRIFQEWITNCIRHGQASRIRIECFGREHHLLLRIESNGAAFRWDGRDQTAGEEDRAAESGQGLKNIRTRAESIHARARTLSGPSGGSRFVLRVPV